MKRTIAVLVAMVAGCSGSQAGRDAEEPLDERPSFGSESAGEDVGVLTPQLARQGLENQGCMDVEVLESVELDHPNGQVLVMVAELCEGFEDDGRQAFIVSSVGTEYVMSNTLHPLPGIGGSHTDAVQVISLETARPSSHGPSIAVLRYRTPPESESDSGWLEQLVVGTFSADALDLAVVQPLNYDLRVGGGHLVGEGSFELVDTDGDGDLDLSMRLSATGTGCRGRRQCRNGEHSCEVSIPWRAAGYEVELSGDDCIYLGQLEL